MCINVMSIIALICISLDYCITLIIFSRWNCTKNKIKIKHTKDTEYVIKLNMEIKNYLYYYFYYSVKTKYKHKLPELINTKLYLTFCTVTCTISK